MIREPQVPQAPRAIEKGVPLKLLLNEEAIHCLALNILYVHRSFDVDGFCHQANTGLEPLSLMQRGRHVACALRPLLPSNYSEAIDILVKSLTPQQPFSEEFGLAGMFYLPHGFFIAEFGQDAANNDGVDPFDVAFEAMYQLTKRFTAEFAIRDFIIQQPERCFAKLATWLDDDCPHVRRLCSEGTRPRLPWGKRLKSLVIDPTPTLDILEQLKNDDTLYVRRSVANHLGDIAKDHPDVVFSMCDNWLTQGASNELKWVIRHAVRHPAKNQNETALELRVRAKV